MRKIPLSKVFVAGGMPSHTYISRESHKLENDLKREIAEGYKIICVTGPTKSGKTVLCKQVLKEKTVVWVQGGQTQSSDDFWNHLIAELEIPYEKEFRSEDELTMGISYIFEAKTSTKIGEAYKVSISSKKKILSFMIAHDIVLAIDDFHYIDKGLQKEIILSLKSEIFDGLIAILIAVPHRAFDAIAVEREMQGRFANINIKSWDESDLKSISDAGFSVLNADLSQSCRDTYAIEAHGSPLLMQRFCSRTCSRYEVIETQQKRKSINPSDEAVIEIFSDVSSQFGFPTYEALSKGPQSRSKRIDRPFKDKDGSADIYEATLIAVSNTGPKEKIPYNEIRDELKKIITEDKMPQKHEISAALKQMSKKAKDEISGEPVVEWSDDYLYITDPFLMFYMRWQRRSGGD
jgi:hypothetical protein